MLATYRNLPRNVWILGAISLLNDSASELVYPLLPLYLSAVLMATPRALGLIEGMAEALSSVVKLISGALSDRFANRKLPMVVGYAIPALVRPAFALVGSLFGVFALRLFDRVGKALRSAPRDALLAASVGPESRGLAFGLHRSMDHLGAVIGPLLAWLLIYLNYPLRDVLLWAIVPGLLCVALALQVKGGENLPQAHNAFDWRWQALPKPFRRYLLALAVFALGNSSNMFLLLRAKDAGLSTADTLLCWALMNLLATLLSAPLAGWSDRIGRFGLLRAGWLLYAGLYLLMGWLPGHFTALLLTFGAFGVFMALTDGIEKAVVADLLDKKAAAASFGWFYLATGLPLVLASYLFGELWMRLSPFAAFGFSASCAVLACLLLGRVRSESMNPTVTN
jgi:MFS family permease